MVTQCIVRGGLLATLLLFGLSVTTTESAAGDLLKSLKGVTGIATSALLPAISNPKPYRQVILTTCIDDPMFGGICVVKFNKVATSRLLEIETIDCYAPTGVTLAFLLNNANIAEYGDHLLAIIPFASGVSVVHGPFYAASGERPTILASSQAGNQIFCSIFGTLWQTN